MAKYPEASELSRSFPAFSSHLQLYLLVVPFTKPSPGRYNFPPSPLKLLLIRNLHTLLRGSPHHTLSTLAKKHGPIMLLQLGSFPTLVVSSADIVRDVMKTHDHVFCSRPKLNIPTRLLYNCDIVFAQYGEYWRHLQKICVLQLLSSKCVQSYHTVREEEIELMMEIFQKCSVSSSEVNLSEIFSSLANNIVCRVALGRKYEEDGHGSRFKEIVEELMYLVGAPNVADFVPLLGLA